MRLVCQNLALLLSEDDNDCMEVEDASDNDDDGSSDDEDDEVSGQINTEEAKANVKVKLLSLMQVKQRRSLLQESFTAETNVNVPFI